jgi:hypothetical protein
MGPRQRTGQIGYLNSLITAIRSRQLRLAPFRKFLAKMGVQPRCWFPKIQVKSSRGVPQIFHRDSAGWTKPCAVCSANSEDFRTGTNDWACLLSIQSLDPAAGSASFGHPPQRCPSSAKF